MDRCREGGGEGEEEVAISQNATVCALTFSRRTEDFLPSHVGFCTAGSFPVAPPPIRVWTKSTSPWRLWGFKKKKISLRKHAGKIAVCWLLWTFWTWTGMWARSSPVQVGGRLSVTMPGFRGLEVIEAHPHCYQRRRAVPPSGGQIQHRVFLLLVNSVSETGFLHAGLHLDAQRSEQK